jgi:hypothetical protein
LNSYLWFRVDGFNTCFLHARKRYTAERIRTGAIRQRTRLIPGYSGKVTIAKLTKGNWQVEWAKWTIDNNIVFASTESNGTQPSAYPGYARTPAPTFIGPSAG